MAVLKNRAKMTTSSTGTGTITLGSANTGYQSFADAGVANSDVVRYVIEDGNNWEIGLGTYTSSGTTLSRTVSESSSSGAALNLSGSATVFITAAAEDLPNLYADNPVSAVAPTASGNNAVAIGEESTASGTDSISLGSDSDATQTESSALGKFAQATGSGSVSLGARSVASGQFSVALGGYTDATAISSIAIGYAAQAVTGSGATAIGNSYASGADSFAAAIANNSSSYGATGANSVSIGKLAKATGTESIAIGRENIASGERSFAAGGYNATASGTDTVAIGYQAQATAAYAAAIGFSNEADGIGSLALGYNSTASSQNSVVIGNGVQSTAANQVSIGGTTDTVRISETYTLPTADGTNGQVLTTDGSGAVTFADAGGGGGGADLYAANESSPAAQPSATGANAIAIGDSAISSGEDAFAGPFSRAAGDDSVALGIANNSSVYGAGGLQSISIGQQSRAMALQSVALGSGAYVDSDSARGIALGQSAYVQQCDFGTAIGAAARVHGGNSASEATAFGSSYASGTSSFAAAMSANTSSYGAQGANSIALGKQAKSTGANSVSIGWQSQATGGSAVALNYQAIASGYGSVSTGQNSNASASYSTVIGGRYGEANEKSKVTFGGGNWLNDGGAVNLAHQTGLFNLAGFTTDGTAKALTTYDSTASSDNQVVLPNNSAYAFSGTIVAREKASEGTDCAAWEIKGLIRREGSAGTTVLVNSATTVLDNTPNWGLALSADTTNGCLKVAVTGAASTNIRWSGTITTSELIYA